MFYEGRGLPILFLIFDFWLMKLKLFIKSFSVKSHLYITVFVELGRILKHVQTNPILRVGLMVAAGCKVGPGGTTFKGLV